MNNLNIEELKNFPRDITQARKLGLSHYYTGKPCINGHYSLRNVSYSKCLKCDELRQKQRRRHPKKRLIISAQRKLRYQENRETLLKKNRDRYASNPQIRMKALESDLKRKFGLTLDDYNRMLNLQNGRCAICKSMNVGRKDGVKFAVDHDHSSGQLRGLLCKRCNTMLGNAKDSIDILRAAKAYLNRHSSLL